MSPALRWLLILGGLALLGFLVDRALLALEWKRSRRPL